MRLTLALLLFLLILSRAKAQEYFFNSDLPENFVEIVNNSYPEGQEITDEMLKSGPSGLITISEDTELFMSFINEEADYRNSFGYFVYDNDLGIIEENIIFENASKVGSKGDLVVGDSYSLGTIEANTTIGFFLGANSYNNNFNHRTYYSKTDLNVDGISHALMTYDNDYNQLVVGFEEKYKGGDKDYNDLIFTIFTGQETKSSFQSSVQEADIIKLGGRQKLRTVTGMVRMSVAAFARVQLPDEIILYPEDLSTQQNITFSGVREFLVESNTGVIISVNPTPLSNGVDELFVNYQIDGNPHSFYTPQDSKHKAFHVLKLSSFIENLSQVEAQDYTGNVTLTLAVY